MKVKITDRFSFLYITKQKITATATEPELPTQNSRAAVILVTPYPSDLHTQSSCVPTT